MDLEQKYYETYEALDGVIQARIKNGRYMAMGYTSNLDFLCDFDVERLNDLLKEHMPKAVLKEMQAADTVRTMQDLLETMVYYCSNGIGGEVNVEDTKLVEENFHFEYGMGGTAVQAAMALNEIGCPSIVHLTDDSKEVCGILNTPGVFTISQDGDLVHTDCITQTQEQEPHYIIQFKKGDQICLGTQQIEIPCSNRLILTKITVNQFVPFSKPYFEWIERNANQVSSIVLSSFNALTDPELLKERLDYVKQHTEKYHRNNPKGIVFFEDAHYHDLAIKKLCLETIYSSVDIVSMNEEELDYTLNDLYHHGVDIEDIHSCIEGAKYIRDRFEVRKGVMVHTKDYSMYVGEAMDADLERGLMYGNMLATAKAKNGWYGTREQVREILEYGFSVKGEENYKAVMEGSYTGEIILVPSKHIYTPKYTIGLGDSFVGGIQMCF